MVLINGKLALGSSGCSHAAATEADDSFRRFDPDGHQVNLNHSNNDVREDVWYVRTSPGEVLLKHVTTTRRPNCLPAVIRFFPSCPRERALTWMMSSLPGPRLNGTLWSCGGVFPRPDRLTSMFSFSNAKTFEQRSVRCFCPFNPSTWRRLMQHENRN